MSNPLPTSEFDGNPELIKKRSRTIAFHRTLIAIGLVYVVITLTINAVNAIISFQTRNELLDCTAPTGECYSEGQERTVAFIQQLIDSTTTNAVTTRRVVVAAAACAQTHDNLLDIEACVKDELERVGDIVEDSVP